jgi:hypothetical protein
MNFKSKKFWGVAALAIAIIASGYFLLLLTHHKISDTPPTFLDPGDSRITSRPRYFDVISIEARLNNPEHVIADVSAPINLSDIPPGVQFSDDDFSRLAHRIFEEEFFRRPEYTGVIFAKNDSSYTHESNPHMMKVEMSLQKYESGKFRVRMRAFRTYWATQFVLGYKWIGSRDPFFEERLASLKSASEEEKSLWKQKFLKVKPFVSNQSRGFLPPNRQGEFINAVEDGVREIFQEFMEYEKAQPEVARKYSAILLENIKVSKGSE